MSYAAAYRRGMGDIPFESTDAAMCARYNCPRDPNSGKCQCMVPERPDGVSTPPQYLPAPVSDPNAFWTANAAKIAACAAKGGVYNFIAWKCMLPPAPAPVVPAPVVPEPGLPIAPPQVPVVPVAPPSPWKLPVSPAGLALIAGVALIGGAWLFRKKHGPIVKPAAGRPLAWRRP